MTVATTAVIVVTALAATVAMAATAAIAVVENAQVKNTFRNSRVGILNYPYQRFFSMLEVDNLANGLLPS